MESMPFRAESMPFRAESMPFRAEFMLFCAEHQGEGKLLLERQSGDSLTPIGEMSVITP